MNKLFHTLMVRMHWSLWRRLQLARTIAGFTAHPFSYADTLCRFDKYVRIYKPACLYRSHLGFASYTSARMVNVTAGKFCSIGRAEIGGQGRHPTRWLTTHPAFYSARGQSGLSFCTVEHFAQEPRETLIGNDVWIGDGAVVMEGVTIGDGAIIAASAIVVKSVSPYTVVGGGPAKVIRDRFPPDVIEALLNWKWWDLPEHALRMHSSKFRGHEIWSLADIRQLQHVFAETKQ